MSQYKQDIKNKKTKSYNKKISLINLTEIYGIVLSMKKGFGSKRYRYFCNVIRAKYQAKRRPLRHSKGKSLREKSVREFGYKTLKLNQGDINKVIKDTIEITNRNNKFSFSFKELKDFDLGLCLIFTCLLEYFSHTKAKKFAFRKSLMPKNKFVRDMFIQTGIFKILCDKNEKVQDGKLAIKKVECGGNADLTDMLLTISSEIVDFALNSVNNDERIKRMAQNYLNKIFAELLLNVKSHANAPDKISYVAAEINQGIIKFAVLDRGIGFAMSVKNRSTKLQKVQDIILNTNVVRTIFESNRERDKNYSGAEFRRGNGTKRLMESIKRCKGAKMQIVSKRDFYKLEVSSIGDTLSEDCRVDEHEALGTLISFELPLGEFLTIMEVKNDRI